MTIYLISGLINCSLALLILALTALVIAVTVGQVRKVAYQLLADAIQLKGLWLGQNNGQILAELQQKSLALELHHKGRMLDVEADLAQLPIKRERLGLLASLEKAEKG